MALTAGNPRVLASAAHTYIPPQAMSQPFHYAAQPPPLPLLHTKTLEVGILQERGVPLGWNSPTKTPRIPCLYLLETTQGGINDSEKHILHSPLASSFHPNPCFHELCHLPPAIPPVPMPPGIPVLTSHKPALHEGLILTIFNRCFFMHELWPETTLPPHQQSQ
jgi:hypothetical protein